jgi:hypothetical protein
LTSARRSASLAAAAALALAASVARAQPPAPTEPAAPARGGEVEVRVEPERLTLGEDGGAQIVVALPEGAREVRIRAAAGKVRDVAIGADGTATGSYTPPDAFVPRVDFVAAIVETRDGTKAGFAAIPLTGQGEAVLKTRPRAQAKIRIGDREYGPVQADKSGQARIRIRVPPGTSVGIDERGVEVALGVPAMPRVAVFPRRVKFSSRPDEPEPLYVFAARADGTAVEDAAAASLAAEVGTVSALRAIGRGAFAAEYAPPPGASGKVVITASLAEPAEPPATVELRLSGKANDSPGAGGTAPASKAPSGHPRVDVGLLLGYATSFGALNTFDVSAAVGYEPLSTRVALRLGARAGFSASRADSADTVGEDATADAEATLWVVPVVVQLGARVPFARDEWSFAARIEAGGAMIDSSIRVRSEGDDVGDERVRAWLPAFGGAVEVGRWLGPGQLLAELRYLQLFRAPESIVGNMGMLYASLGYRLAFDI